MKNMMDFCIGTPCYWIIGFGLMFGGTGALIGGFDPFIQGDYSHLGLDIPLWVYIVFQTVFCATAATIVSGSMAERTNFKAYCVYSAAISLVVYPICGHWMWGGGWLQSMGFHDFAGSAAVHNVGGVIALLGAWMLAYYAVEAVATRVPSSIGGTMWGLFFLINMVSGMLIRFVMRKLGMTYRYSYEELWQPKNFPVIFRMYQLNLNGDNEFVYRKYWDEATNHFVEDL